MTTWLAYAGVLFVAAVVHWPVLSAQAVVFDDQMYLFDNRVLMQPSWSNAGLVLREVFRSTTVEGYYEPLTLHSLMLDVCLGGRADNLLPFHRTSLILHLANTLLVMVLLNSLCRQPLVSAMVGLLFAVHPLSVEPVAWVWERKTLLATFFVIASLIAYVRYARTGGRRAYAASLLLFIPALMSKPTVTPLPVMLVLLDLWPLRRPIARRMVIEKIPFFALSLVFGLITIISTARTGVVRLEGESGIVLKTLYLVGFYASKIVWPAPLTAAYALPDPMRLTNFAVLWRVALAVSVAALVTLGSLRWSRSWFTTATWVLSGLLPTLGIVSYSWVVASDKYVYFPSIGLLIAIAFALGIARERLERRTSPAVARAVIVATCVGPLALAVVQTRRYLAEWQDTVRLARHMLAVGPGSANVYTLLGNACWQRGNLDEAAAAFRSALQLDPSNTPANVLYAGILGQQGRFDEAVASLQRAPLRGTQAALASSEHLLGRLRVSQGRLADAFPHFLEAVRMQPHLVAPRLELGLAYLKEGQLDSAREQFTGALRQHPDPADRTDALMNLGLIALRQGRPAEAGDFFRSVLAVSPADPRAHFQLGLIAQTAGSARAAVVHYRAALAANPSSTARNNLAWILATDPDASVRDGAEALRLLEPVARAKDPRFDTLDTLAAAYAEAGDFDKAVTTVERGLQAAEQQKPVAATLVEEMRARHALYRERRPYRERAGALTAPAATVPTTPSDPAAR